MTTFFVRVVCPSYVYLILNYVTDRQEEYMSKISYIKFGLPLELTTLIKSCLMRTPSPVLPATDSKGVANSTFERRGSG